MTGQRFHVVDVDGFVEDVATIADTLSNLTYLIELDAHNPALVRQYAKQAEKLVQALGEMVRSADVSVCAGSCS